MKHQALGKRQTGAVFANLLLGAAAAGSVAVATADWTAHEAALALQRQQGQVFATLNDAVGNYMTLYFPLLTQSSADALPADGTPSSADALPADCSKLPYRHGRSAATEAAILQGRCRLTLPLSSGGQHTVHNGLQPTLGDLKALGLLDPGVSETPVLPTELLVAGPDDKGAASTAHAPNTYAIVIEAQCVGLGSRTASCGSTNKVLVSSLLNVQPFATSPHLQHFLPLMSAAGPDAAMSGPPDPANVVEQDRRLNPTGEFRSVQKGWSRENPVTQDWSRTVANTTVTYTRGVDNLLLMRNGYDSAYWQTVRRDGSTPPTANWDFNGKDLTHVGKLTAESVEVAGDLKVGGHQSLKGNQTVGGNVDVEGSGTFKGLLSALGQLVVQGGTELRGALTVAGKALFQDDVTLEKALRVKGNAQVDGTLAGTSASFSGALTSSSLVVGSTLIGPEGTLLGSSAGWGVTPGAPCYLDFGLAQSTDGKLQICRINAWTPLITSENIVITAPGTGLSCKPEGAPGRLPDGTLAVCKNGKWESTSQGSTTEGRACSVEGSLATGKALPSSNLILLGCQNGKWTRNVFSKPKLGYAYGGNACTMEDELALDDRGYPSLLVCKNGQWRAPGTQLLANMQKGAACTLDGVLASDTTRTGLLICTNGLWTKTTEPVNLGETCSPNGQVADVGNGQKKYCVNGVWSDLPDSIQLVRSDGALVVLNRLVQLKDTNFYLYNEPLTGRLNKSQSYHNLAVVLWGQDDTHEGGANGPGTIHSGKRCNGKDHLWKELGSGDRYLVCIATHHELYRITDQYGGRPAAWQFEFQDGAEVWSSTRRDECTDWGCDQPWQPSGGAVFDHVSVDLWNKHTFHRWNADRRPVVFSAQKVN